MILAAEKYRCKDPLGRPHKLGDPFGTFLIPTSPTGPKMFVVVSMNEGGWDHVSVSLAHRTPTWQEMCRAKDLFFHPDDVVVQYHPASGDYVNQAENCLHLWKPRTVNMPTPPTWMVGFK